MSIECFARARRIAISMATSACTIAAYYPFTSKNVQTLEQIKQSVTNKGTPYDKFDKFWKVGLRNRVCFVTANEFVLTQILDSRKRNSLSPLVIPTKVMFRRGGLMLQRDVLSNFQQQWL